MEQTAQNATGHVTPPLVMGGSGRSSRSVADAPLAFAQIGVFSAILAVGIWLGTTVFQSYGAVLVVSHVVAFLLGRRTA